MVGMRNATAAFKIQEFVAHASNVNCLHIGRKSCEVLVTGGDDKKVNVWTIGKPNAILSLSGHTSAVECVSFDALENVVIAGSAGGTLKLWDLEQGKVARTLTGHRSNCISVHWHPYGEFFASGSLDTNLKIWDIRRKGCIQTYKGHMRGIHSIMFSPDGRWVVSGGEDGVVKLWDLTAGKLMHDFTLHESVVTSMDFHPNEFLLATGSTDRTVKLWDLETFECIGSSAPEMTCVRAVAFDDEGSCAVVGAEESLKVLGWEPMRSFDHLDVRWNRLADMCLRHQQGGAGNQLMGASYREALVAVWAVDMQNLQPFAPRSGGGVAGGLHVNGVGVQARQGQGPGRLVDDMKALQVQPLAQGAQAARPDGAPSARPAAGAPRCSVGTEMGESMKTEDAATAQGGPSANFAFDANQLPRARYPPSTAGAARTTEAAVGGDPPTSAPPPAVGSDPNAQTIIPANRSAPIGLDPSAFLPKTPLVAEGPSDQQLLASLLQPKVNQAVILSHRLATLQGLRSLWVQGEAKRVVQSLAMQEDQAVVVDFLRSNALAHCNLDLEMACMLMPLLQSTLPSHYEEYILAAMDGASLIVRSFGGMIRDQRVAAAAGNTTVAGEERLARCNMCYDGLSKMVPDLQKLATRPPEKAGRVRQPAIDLLENLQKALDIKV